LSRTYGYRPLVLTTSAPDQELRDGVAFCEINSFLTGRRLVSLPFSDHCEPLVERADTLEAILATPQCRLGRRKYVELRPRSLRLMPQEGFTPYRTFHLHTINLSRSVDQLLHSFHRDGVQRKLRRAEREGLVCEEGRSSVLLDHFYRLFVLTRRRHRLPPPSRNWFRNLRTYVGDALTIRIAYKNRHPVAGLLTMRHRHTLLYKYACSDARFHNLGGVILLLWKAIREGKREGLTEFDLGRSDPAGIGLVTFKDHWGTARSTLTYFRHPEAAPQESERSALRFARVILAHLPAGLLRLAGRLLYPHAG
jgi:hypothetical protein